MAWLLLLLGAGESYGRALMGELENRGIHGEPSLVYRALEHEGAITSRWRESAHGPRRRCYRLTRKGRRMLADFAADVTAACELHELPTARRRPETALAAPSRREHSDDGLITIGIDPTIELGPKTRAWHGITIALGIVIGALAAGRWLRERDLSPAPMHTFAVLAAVGDIVGARVFYLLEHDQGALLAPDRLTQATGSRLTAA